MIDDETLMAFADGEIAGARAAEIAAAVAADPALATQLERLRRTRAALHAAYDGVAEEPVPERLLAVLRGEPVAAPAPAGEVVDFAEAKAARDDRKVKGSHWPNWAALAATLLVGVIAGKFVEIGPRPLIGSHDGGMTAEGPLAAALDRQLASDPAGGTVRIGLSFREATGNYCRTFRAAARDGVAGIACRDDGGWAIRMAVAAGPLQGSDYRMANSDTPPAVLVAVGQMIEGEALDARAETAARAKGWK